LKEQKNDVKEKNEIFKSILFVKMKISKLINQFIQQTCVEVAKVLWYYSSLLKEIVALLSIKVLLDNNFVEC
jgi:hypothetical protein